jgi:cytochrome c oxidase assembly protein subunit 15
MSLIRRRSCEYKPWLAGYGFLTLAATVVLLYAGGFTTTIGAGMVFADWPLSNGSLNPPGWTTDQAMLAEHGHRLLGAVVGLLCAGLCLWLHLAEPRRWMRRLGLAALLLVGLQGLLGGLRVLLVNIDLAKLHGVTAQVFLCLLTTIAVGSARWWRRLPPPAHAAARADLARFSATGLAICLLLIVQLVVGAILRHRGAGLAIPYFPYASPTGSLLPVAWNWATALNFGHRAGALLIFALIFGWLLDLWRSPHAMPVLRRFALAAFILVNIQVALGAGIVWSARAPIETTLHVLNAAVLLSVCWALTCAAAKPFLNFADENLHANPAPEPGRG